MLSPLLKKLIPPITALVFAFTYPAALRAGSELEDESNVINHLLYMAKNPPVYEENRAQIYLKGEILFCTGDSKAADANNRAAELMVNGDFKTAVPVLEDALKHDALFFPFRYNLGMCYLHMNLLDNSMMHFEKALAVVPEFSKTYLQIGFIHQLRHRDTDAIYFFREAIRRDPKELDTFIRIGDIFYNRSQIEMAKKYYDASLKIDHRFPNGILGRAKIHFKEGRYIHAINMMKTIDLKRDYDKSLHYYYGEAAFKLKDYATAAYHYEKLLSFKSDRFFITNSAVLIEHKRNMSERLSGK